MEPAITPPSKLLWVVEYIDLHWASSLSSPTLSFMSEVTVLTNIGGHPWRLAENLCKSPDLWEFLCLQSTYHQGMAFTGTKPESIPRQQVGKSIYEGRGPLQLLWAWRCVGWELPPVTFQCIRRIRYHHGGLPLLAEHLFRSQPFSFQIVFIRAFLH